jgi:hypothetical protein
VLLAIFDSSIETVSSHICEKVVRCKNFTTVSTIYSCAYIQPMIHTLPDNFWHVLCNIWDCFSDSCFEFIQHNHSLAVHLVFHITLKKTVKRNKIRRMRGPHIWFSCSVHLPGKFMCKQSLIV